MRRSLLLLIAVILVISPVSAITTTSTTGISTETQPVISSENIYILESYYEPSPAEPGQRIKLFITAENIGNEDLDVGVFRLNVDYPFSLDPDDDGIIVSSVSSRSKKILEYSFRVDSLALADAYEVDLEICSNMDCTVIDRTYPVQISVGTAKPNLKITEIETLPADVIPGNTFKLGVTLTNFANNRIRDINLKLDLTSADIPFAPKSSLGEQFLPSLDVGQSKILTFDLIASGDADTKLHKIPTTLTYSDLTGAEYSTENIIGLVVGGKPELQISLDERNYLMRSAKDAFTLNIINSGPLDAKLLTVKLLPKPEYEILSPESVYVGNVDSDDIEGADFEIITSGIKEIELPFEITYRDVNNVKYTEMFPLTVKVLSQGETEKSNAGAGVLVLLILLAIVFVGYRKRDKLIIIYNRLLKVIKKK